MLDDVGKRNLSRHFKIIFGKSTSILPCVLVTLLTTYWAISHGVTGDLVTLFPPVTQI